MSNDRSVINRRNSNLKASDRALFYLESKSPDNSKIIRDGHSPSQNHISYQDKTEMSNISRIKSYKHSQKKLNV